MKNIRFTFLIILIILIFSCSNNEVNIQNNCYYLSRVDSININIKLLQITDLSFQDNYTFITYLKPLLIDCYDSLGDLSYSLNVEGEAPGKGFILCKNGVFNNNDTIIVFFNIPSKISKFTKEGIFIRDLKIINYQPMNVSLISDSIYIFAVLSYYGTKYIKFNTKNENFDSIFNIQLLHPQDKYQQIIDNDKRWSNQHMFSTNDTLIFIPDIYNGSIFIFDFCGNLIAVKDLNIQNWSPTPFIDVINPHNKDRHITLPAIHKPIYQPIILDSLIIIRIVDFFKDNWKEYKKSLNPYGEIDYTLFDNYLYIYNNDFELLDILEVKEDNVWKIYTYNNLIYIYQLFDEEDSSCLIRYRYRLEEIGN